MHYVFDILRVNNTDYVEMQIPNSFLKKIAYVNKTKKSV